ncbi:MAG: sulfite exporter TauE/SafE family protein [Dialister sp.]|nr:sulfite exporter TauE/SafE family protein [Dialister sp.]
MDTFLTYAIICPLVGLAGFIDAVAGGGGLISLPAYILSGIPIHGAIATNKMSASMGTALATFKYAKRGFIPWRLALTSVLFAFAGSSVGAHIALMLDAKVFTVCMLVILPLTGAYILRGKTLKEKEPFPWKKTALISCGLAFAIGIYDGFYGPGTGTFLFLALTGIGHLKMKQANGVTKVINLCTNLSALTVFLLSGHVLLGLGITAGLFNMAGNYLGANYFSKANGNAIKPIIAAVLVIFFFKVLWDLFLS